MKVGVQVPWLDRVLGREYFGALGPAVEERGFESIWVSEHVVSIDDPASPYPYSADGRVAAGLPGMSEPLTALAFLAATTTVVRLGTAACILPQRNPVYLAKEAACVDVLSGGRLELGVAVGWMREEYEALGAQWAGRGARMDEYLAVVRELWGGSGAASFDGEHYRLPPCRIEPGPVQRPGPRIHIGGNGVASLRRVGAGGDGWIPFKPTVDEVTGGIALLERTGRSRSEIEVSVCLGAGGATVQAIEAYRAAGADRVIASAPSTGVDELRRQLDDLTTVVEGLR